MTNRQPRVSGQEVLMALERGGYTLSHIRGSHHYLRRPDGSGLVVVPVHGNRTLPIGTLHSILRQAGLTVEQFLGLFRN